MAVVPKTSDIQTLKKLIPLNLLPEADLEQLLETATFRKDRAGSYLFRQGDTDYHNIYLLSGKVALLEDAKEVDRVAAGSETARFPIGHQIPRKNSARAVGVVEYVLIDNRKLSELLVRNKDDDYKVADLNASIGDDWMDQLLQSKVFQQIPPSNIQGVIMRMEELEVKRGEKVVEQGGDGDYFFLIHQGRCKVTRKEDGKSKATELAKLGPGDSFGEEALLSDSPRNSTVTMLTNGKLLRLAKEDFIEFVKRPLAKGVSFEEADLLISKGAVWLDVRMPSAYEAGHLENSVSFPLDILRYQAPNLAPDQSYVICCDDGHVSSTAAYLLTDRGFAVSVLEGGLRTVPSEMLIKDDVGSTASRAKVISLRPGEEMADKPAGSADLDKLRKQLDVANSKIKELGAKFQKYREEQQKEEAKRKAEIKAQQAIIDKSKIRLDEVKARREVDQKLIERLQNEPEELNSLLKEATEKLGLAEDNVIDLEAKLNAAYDAEQTLTAERDEHEQQLHTYQNELNVALAEKNALEQKLEEVEKGYGDSAQQQDVALAEAEQQINQLKAELVKSHEGYDSSQSELGESKEKLGLAEASIASIEERLNVVTAEKDALEQKLEEVDRGYGDSAQQQAAALAEAEQQITQLNTELIESREAYQSSQSELRESKEKLGLAEASIASIEEKLNVVTAEKDALEQNFKEADKGHEDTAQKQTAALAEAEQQISKLDAELVKLGERFESSQFELDEVKSALLGKSSELGESLEKLRLAEASITNLEGKLTAKYDSELAITAERDEHKMQLHSHQKRLEEVVAENESLEKRLQKALKGHGDSAQKQDKALAKTEKQINQLTAELAKAKEGYESSQSELDEVKSALLGKSSELGEALEKLRLAEASITNFEKRLAAGGASESELATEREDYEQQLLSYQDRLEDVLAEKGSLEQSLEEIQQDYVNKQSEFEELTDKLKQAEANIASLEDKIAAGDSSDSALAAEREDYEQQLLGYQNRLETAVAEKDTLEDGLKQIQKDFVKTQTELEEAKTALLDRSSEKQIEQLQYELEKTNGRLQESLSEIEELKRALDDRETEFTTAQSQHGQQSGEEVTALKAEVETLTEALGEADLAYDQIREQAEELSREKEEILKKLRSLERESIASPNELIDKNRTSIEREVFGEAFDDVVSKGLEMAEEDALRQEFEELEKRSSNWEQRLMEAENRCKSLDDALEDRDEEIDRIKRELDERKAKLTEAVEQRQQSEQTASQLREMVAHGLAANEQVDPRFAGSSQTPRVEKNTSDRPSLQSTLLWMLLGVVVCFVVLEAAMLLSGRGELITGLFKTSGTNQESMEIPDGNAPPSQLPPTQLQRDVNIKDENNTTTSPTNIANSVEDNTPPWVVLDDIKFGPAMIKLRGGRFVMGSNQNQVSGDQWPAHEVEISAFAISQTEITFDDYDRFAQATGRVLPNDQGWGRGTRPVVDVSWEDAVAYTKWLSERTGKLYRLPTEAEWEYAVRGGSDSAYWWGYQVEEGKANCFECGSEWDRKSTAPAASFPPNNFGLHDMAGNVREWVSDCYHPNYSGAPLDGSAWTEIKCNERVVRGGAYNKTSDSMRSTWRGHLKPNLRFNFTGFRVVREL